MNTGVWLYSLPRHTHSCGYINCEHSNKNRCICTFTAMSSPYSLYTSVKGYCMLAITRLDHKSAGVYMWNITFN